MVSRRVLLGATLACVLVGLLGVVVFVRQRVADCRALPLMAENLLPGADLAQPGTPLPPGWQRYAGGVERGTFALDGDQRAIQLMGIANYVQPPPVAVSPNTHYCFTAFAISDAPNGSGTRVRVVFRWLDARGALLAESQTVWQPVAHWSPDQQRSWSPIQAAAAAPPGAATLQVRIHPAADDRIYLDVFAVRAGGQALPAMQSLAAPAAAPAPTLSPWPDGRRAAVSFSFDWETAMGGLVHSRSADDPRYDQNYLARGLRMRAGVTTTLQLLQPYGVRATYFANGYNFLEGNPARIQFMGNPTYPWASRENAWLSDRWTTTPWFADDPYGTVASHPEWYFADLVAPLLRTGQFIQSHTFSHFYGGFVGPRDWSDDLGAWADVAAAHGLPPATALAFPWSSSGGMSDANWTVLADAGITVVTRLSDQKQFDLFPRDDRGLIIAPICRPLPAHPRILACPDMYLNPRTAGQALAQIDRAAEVGGMIDLFAHTEEVISAEEQAAWRQVVAYAAGRDDLWVAPLPEIAAWQHALARVTLDPHVPQRCSALAAGECLTFTITNRGATSLDGLTVALPFAAGRVQVVGQPLPPQITGEGRALVLAVPAGTMLEVHVWPG